MKKPRILFADDNDDILAVFQKTLEGQSSPVLAAASALEAQRFISTEQFYECSLKPPCVGAAHETKE